MSLNRCDSTGKLTSIMVMKIVCEHGRDGDEEVPARGRAS
jgi:hypothetical protein